MPEIEGEAFQARERERAALGALLFIAAVESAFQLHTQCAPPSRSAAAHTSGSPPGPEVSAVLAHCNSVGPDCGAAPGVRLPWL